MKILITGYFGAGNFGDDMMLEAFCNEMKDINKKHEIHLLKMFDREINVNIDKNIKEIKLFKLTGKLQKIAYIATILKYDMLIWVGGTCFTDEDGDGFYHFMKIAKMLNKKIGYVGVGVGKLTNQDRIDKSTYLIKQADFISLRDKRSYEYVKDIRGNLNNVFLTEDLAYLFINRLNIPHLNTSENNYRRNIIISWRSLVNYKSNLEEINLIKELTEYIKALLSDNIQSDVIILPLDDRKDCEVNKIIYDNLKIYSNQNINIIYKELLTPLEKINLILNCDINISGRLHGIFVSELANKKTIGLSYSVKIDEFLNSIGKGCDCINISNLNVESLKEVYKSNDIKVSEELIKLKIEKSKENIYLLNKYLS